MIFIRGIYIKFQIVSMFFANIPLPFIKNDNFITLFGIREQCYWLFLLDLLKRFTLRA